MGEEKETQMAVNEEMEYPEYDKYSSLDVVQDTMDTLLAAADVDSVYQEPIEHGDTVMIPAGEVVAVMGFGAGSGSGSDEEGAGGDGAGGGGGGRVFSRPVAVIISDKQGVRVEPVFDLTKIALAALTTGAFMLGMIARLNNPKEALKELEKGSW